MASKTGHAAQEREDAFFGSVEEFAKQQYLMTRCDVCQTEEAGPEGSCESCIDHFRRRARREALMGVVKTECRLMSADDVIDCRRSCERFVTNHIARVLSTSDRFFAMLRHSVEKTQAIRRFSALVSARPRPYTNNHCVVDIEKKKTKRTKEESNIGLHWSSVSLGPEWTINKSVVVEQTADTILESVSRDPSFSFETKAHRFSQKINLVRQRLSDCYLRYLSDVLVPVVSRILLEKAYKRILQTKFEKRKKLTKNAFEKMMEKGKNRRVFRRLMEAERRGLDDMEEEWCIVNHAGDVVREVSSRGEDWDDWILIEVDEAEDIEENDELDSEESVYSDDEDEEDQTLEPIVGAPGTCWKKVHWLKLSLSGDHVTTQQFIQHCERYPLWFFAKEQYLVNYVVTDEEDLHLWDVQKATIMESFDKSSYVTLGTFVEFLKTHKKHRQSHHVEVQHVDSSFFENSFSFSSVYDDECYVGGINEVMNAAKALYGPELMKAEAAKELTGEGSARHTTKFYLTTAQRMAVEKYVNFAVASESKTPTNGDHVQLQVARDLIRKDLTRVLEADGSTSTVLHVGATMLDVRTWSSNPNHVFYFHLSETKDATRVKLQLVNFFMSKIKSLPALKTQFGESAKLLRLSFDDIIHHINTYVFRRQCITLTPVVADVLVFSDSLYGITEREFARYFSICRAKMAFGLLFLPTYLYGDQPINCSEFYNLKHDYDWNTQELLDKIWPEILAGFAISERIPGSKEGWDDHNEKTLLDNIVGFIHRKLVKMLSYGKTAFLNWLDGFLKTQTPVESVFGVLASVEKYRIIGNKWYNRIIDAMNEKMRYLIVTWKDGFANGYRHKEAEWKKWATERVFRGEGFDIAAEITHRVGEMTLMMFWRSDVADVVVAQPAPPKHLRRMRIWDWQATIKNNPLWLAGDVAPVWTSCNVEDFYEVYSWCMGEPIDKLSFTVVATAANRARRGLSLVSNVSHDGLSIRDEELANFALNVYLAVYRDRNEITKVENWKEHVTGTITNLRALFAKAVQTAAFVATLGLASVAYSIFTWMITEQPFLEFAERVVDPPVRKYHVRAPITTPTITRQNNTFTGVLPATGKQQVNKCSICTLLVTGELTGQTFAIDKCTHEAKPMQFGLSPAEAAAARTQLGESIDHHRPFVNENTLAAARAHESFLSTIMTVGTSLEVTPHYILGGPGTGKSYVSRALMHKLMKLGYNVAMYLPLASLKPDYDKVKMPDGDEARFEADTWFKMSRHKSLDVLFVDEFTLVDNLHFKAYVNYCQPTNIYFVGDTNQQHKSPDISPEPGIAESGWWPEVLTHCSKHELQRNFRFVGPGAKLRVQWLNHVFGYRMYTTETDDGEILTIQTGADYMAEGDRKQVEMVFAHETCQRAFGMPSGNMEGQENHSVYSSQGTTRDTAAVAVYDGDRAGFTRHGAALVALTRSKEHPIIVVHDMLADVIQDFLHQVGLNDIERFRNNPLATPSAIQRHQLIDVDPASVKLNRVIQEHGLEALDPIGDDRRERKRIVFESNDEEKRLMDANCLMWTLDVFNTCTYDALPMHLRIDFIKDVLVPLAHRSPNVYKKSDGTYGIVGNKLWVNTELFVDWLNAHIEWFEWDLRTDTKIGRMEMHGTKARVNIKFTKGHVEAVTDDDIPKAKVSVNGAKAKYKKANELLPDGCCVGSMIMVSGLGKEVAWNGSMESGPNRAMLLRNEFDAEVYENAIERDINTTPLAPEIHTKAYYPSAPDFCPLTKGPSTDCGPLLRDKAGYCVHNRNYMKLTKDYTETERREDHFFQLMRAEDEHGVVVDQTTEEDRAWLKKQRCLSGKQWRLAVLERFPRVLNRARQVAELGRASGATIAEIFLAQETDFEFTNRSTAETAMIRGEEFPPMGYQTTNVERLEEEIEQDKSAVESLRRQKLAIAENSQQVIGGHAEMRAQALEERRLEEIEAREVEENQEVNANILNPFYFFQREARRRETERRVNDELGNPEDEETGLRPGIEGLAKPKQPARRPLKPIVTKGSPTYALQMSMSGWRGKEAEDIATVGSIIRVDIPTADDEFQRFAPVTDSVWVANRSREKRFESAPPLRTGKKMIGTDSYRLAGFIDGSNAIKQKYGYEYPAVYGACQKPPREFREGFQMNFAATFFERTTSGKIRDPKPKVGASVVRGSGNQFTGDHNETMRALQRLCGDRPTKAPSAEAIEFFTESMRDAFFACHKQSTIDPLEISYTSKTFDEDARTRNYQGRVQAERDRFQNIMTKRVTNKVQYKPVKDGKIDHAKTGQTIAATSAYWNLMHGRMMRVVNLAFKKTLQDDVFYDSYEDANSFRVRMTKAIQKLPDGVSFGIVDGEEFDAGQTAGTLHAEMVHRRLMGISEDFIASYYRIREPGKFVYSGVASGKTAYEKGSGFSDTLLGNTTLEQMVGHHSIVGVGPRVLGLKGDDFLKVQFGLSKNYDFIKKMERYTNLKLKVSISDTGGEFIGCTVGKEGMYLSLPRLALKSVGNKFRNFAHFEQYQQSLRDKMEEVRRDGLAETIAANMSSMGLNRNTVELCHDVVESLSHISRGQFSEFERSMYHKPPLPGRYKPYDFMTFNSF